MNALERLRAVLCAPDGEVVIDGTDADRSIVAEALKELDTALSQPAGVPEGGLEAFTDYFVKNYPGPDTIIYDPKWHAPRIFRAAQRAIQAAAPAASAKYCSDERPCIPCFSNNGPCEDAPAASGGECNCASGRGAEHCVVHAHAAWDAPQPPSGASQSSNHNPVTPGLSSGSGASVSERARNFLAGEVAHDYPKMARALVSGKSMESYVLVPHCLRALERALSSPRQEGECVGEVVAEGYALHECVSFYAGVKQLPIGTKLYTHPSTAASTQGDDNE